MKKHLRLFLLIAGVCSIHCVLFCQDSTGKVYAIKFTAFKTNLTKEAKVQLKDVAKAMKNQPACHFAVTAYCSGTENRRLNKANWDRPNHIITYLVEKLGINGERFTFRYGSEDGDCNTIELALTDEIPNTDPPPHPNLLRKN